MKKIALLAGIVALFFVLSSLTSVGASPAPSVVATGMIEMAYPFQRNTFYANGRYWVFYVIEEDEEEILCYKSSTDGVNWSDPTPIFGGAWSSSVWFDGTYLHIATNVWENLYYRRGIPNADGTITWSADWQLVVSTSPFGWPESLSISTSGNEVFIGYGIYDAYGRYYSYVTKSTVTDGTWTTSEGFPYLLGSWSMVSVVGLTNGKTYAVYTTDGYIWGRLWDGSSWSEEENIGNIYCSWQYSVVSFGDDVFVAFVEDGTNNLVFRKRTYGVGWGPLETFYEWVEGREIEFYVPVLSLDKYTGNVYAFWISALERYLIQGKIYYSKRTETWSDPVVFLDNESFEAPSCLDTFWEVQNGVIGITWLRNLEGWSGVLLMFDYLPVSLPPSPPPYVPPTPSLPKLSLAQQLSPTKVTRGENVLLSLSCRANAWLNVEIAIKVYSSSGALVFHKTFRDLIKEENYQFILNTENWVPGDYTVMTCVRYGGEEEIATSFMSVRESEQPPAFSLSEVVPVFLLLGTIAIIFLFLRR